MTKRKLIVSNSTSQRNATQSQWTKVSEEYTLKSNELLRRTYATSLQSYLNGLPLNRANTKYSTLLYSLGVHSLSKWFLFENFTVCLVIHAIFHTVFSFFKCQRNYFHFVATHSTTSSMCTSPFALNVTKVIKMELIAGERRMRAGEVRPFCSNCEMTLPINLQYINCAMYVQ